MSDTLTLRGLGSLGADVIGAVAAMSNEEHRARLDGAFRRIAADEGEIIAILGEVDRCQSFRDEGATSTESWVVHRYGVSPATARAYTRAAKKAWDIPHLVGSLCAGDLSLDKVRALADVATPETDRELRDQARECSVADLIEIARTNAAAAASAAAGAAGPADIAAAADSEHDRRSLRFNDQCRTLTAQLPAASYAETKAALEARARVSEVPPEAQIPWDQRLCDGFLELIGSQAPGSSGRANGGGGGGGGSSPFFVVAHVPLDSLADASGQSSALAGELDRVGLIDLETVQRIACDATIAIAVDDDVGHTMYEGRARRFATKAQRREVLRRDRHCRFPGCTNVTFANVHHIVPWQPNGLTDLDNLVLQCLHHHHLVHSDGWTMKGNANEELTITGPNGLVMTSRPSPLWTRVTAGVRARARGS
jgi:hypothetical protein